MLLTQLGGGKREDHTMKEKRRKESPGNLFMISVKKTKIKENQKGKDLEKEIAERKRVCQ